MLKNIHNKFKEYSPIKYLFLSLILGFPIIKDDLVFWSFGVPLFAFFALFVTRNAPISLFLGSLLGMIALHSGNLLEVAVFFKDSLQEIFTNSWKMGSILFTLLLGGFSGLIRFGGGLKSVIYRFMGVSKSSRRAESLAASSGFITFFDGLASNLLIGKMNQPLFDMLKIPRVRLAYIADTTGSCIASIAVFSTWIATQVALISEGLNRSSLHSIAESSYWIFIQSIPYNFYSFFALIVLFFAIYFQLYTNGMRSSVSSVNDGESDAVSKMTYDPKGWLRVAIPIFVLIFFSIIWMYFDGVSEVFPITTFKIAMAFSNSQTMFILNVSAMLSIGIALIMNKRRSFVVAIVAFRDGSFSMLSPLIVLLSAWILSKVITELGTVDQLVSLLTGSISPALFPIVILIIGVIVSFFTGTSWGTMALLMPLAISLSVEVLDLHAEADLRPLLAVIGAVFSGSVFGDHCSPFSDTTIVSAVASGVSPYQHVVTQLPYAILALTLSIFMGLVVGFLDLHWIFAYIFGILLMAGIPLVLIMRKS